MRPWFAFRTATTARFRRACSSTAAPIAPAWPSRYGTAIVRIAEIEGGDRARTKEERRGRARAIRTLRHDPDCPPSILQGGAAHVGHGSFSLWESLYQFAHAAHRARLNAIGKLVQAKRRRI